MSLGHISTADILQILGAMLVIYFTLALAVLNISVMLFGGDAKPSVGKALAVSAIPLLWLVIGDKLLALDYSLWLPLVLFWVSVKVAWKMSFGRAAAVSIGAIPVGIATLWVTGWVIG
jgi:hypothetical protein